jgi:hypothetical protein
MQGGLAPRTSDLLVATSESADATETALRRLPCCPREGGLSFGAGGVSRHVDGSYVKQMVIGTLLGSRSRW